MQYTTIILQITILVGFAAIFSGLNISLMSLSLAELKRKAKLGDKRAKRVLPIRRQAHWSLAGILLANVAVVSASSLLLEHRFNGLVAGIVTTLLMVVFGEVLPQAIFVKSALKFMSFFTPLIRFVCIITYPISRPIGLMLDKLVGPVEARAELHTRAELGLLISEHKIGDESELDEDEVEIIQAALQLSEKTVKTIMQPIKEVYWLASDAMLDAKTVDTITANGYSRVPVFDKKLTECYGVLLMKDMVDIDFDEHPVSVMDFKLHKTRQVGSRTALDTMFRKLAIIRSHLIPVEQNGKIIGIITAEDLIEEIIGHEIADETDHALNRD